MRSSSLNNYHIYQLVVYICGFFLFLEWIRPLNTISDTGSLPVFIVYTAFCFFLSILNIKWWLSIPLKFAGIILIIDGLFLSEALFSKAWFGFIYEHLQFNFEVIILQDWVEMTPFFRSLLFLLLLWLMSYLLYYWFVIAKRIFLFILLTFIYVGVLDTFTMYQADLAIVRIFVVSLLAMGVSTFVKALDNEALPYVSSKKLITWMLPLIIVISLSILVGYAAPKLEPQWPDPVPFITSHAENAGLGQGGKRVIQKVGYGEDDSRLGGSFIQDHTEVFRAAVERKHYWRIESKDYYTGKGWERTTEQNYEELVNGKIGSTDFNDTVITTQLQALVRYETENQLPKVVYPYGIESIRGNETKKFLFDRLTGAITISDVGAGSSSRYDGYEIDYRYPSFSINELRSSSENDPELLKQLYVQLPESLPGRVGQLAQEVTSDQDNRYDKVKAIEQYFNRNGYIYQIDNVAIPDRNEDYVDQFLFETKIGYCDNFSSSMVVMLRTLDIPARWVKGFTGGELVADQTQVPDNLQVYKISNSNAHSWVEVFFPDVGWVPFEPTNGFSSPADFFAEASAEPVQADHEEQVVEEEEEEEDQALNIENEEEEENASGGILEEGVNQTTPLQILLPLVFLALLFAIYVTRYRWISFFLLRSYKRRIGLGVYQDAYHFLLKVLAHKGIKRSQGQTLREFAKHVDDLFQTSDMSQFTYQYERILYRNELSNERWGEMTELWENLIKRTLS